MQKLRFAVVGTGFWSHFQIPGWLESTEVELVALCDRDLSKAKEMARRFGVKHVYDDVRVLFQNHDLDFVDIITNVETHMEFSMLAADYGLDIVCQKPMTNSLEEAKELVAYCQQKNVSFFINENFRWQQPIRQLKSILDTGVIGEVFKSRISFCSAFPVFENQPFLRELEHFIIADVGSHILDIARFLFGEAESLFCLIQTVNEQIQGEDVADILMKMKNGSHCYVELSYASILEKEVFPQTLVLIEGSEGSVELKPDHQITITTHNQSNSENIAQTNYPWVDPEYALVHNSIVDTQMNIIQGLKGGVAETTGIDNLETVRLVWAAYQSAKSGEVIVLDQFEK